jgi:hypothetical protein
MYYQIIYFSIFDPSKFQGDVFVPDVYQFFPIVEDNNASRILSQSANLDD